MRVLLRPCLLFALVVASVSGYATTYYIDYVGGTDTNSGTSKTSAWKHAPGMNGCSGLCSSTTIHSTDQLIFKGGVVWPLASMPWLWTYGSTSTANTGTYPGVYLGYDSTWNTGQVLSIRPTSSGYNCTSLTVTITGGGGSGATATANFQTTGYLAGLLQHVTMTSAGSGYTSNPAVSFSGSCDTYPTAIADIYSPIMDVSGKVWNESNGAQAYYGPIVFSGVNYLTVDHLEFRGLSVDYTLPQSSGSLWLITQPSGNNTVWQNIYVHNFGPSAMPQTGSPAFNSTGGLNIDQGDSSSIATVQNSFFDNFEMELLTSCGWTDSSTSGGQFEPPCGAAAGVAGATNLINNYVHDITGQVYSRAQNGLNYHGNTIWDSVYDCCQRHEDTFYIFGSGMFYNNIVHDASPLGSANFYLESCQGNPCTVGNVDYVFNNVIWHVGRSSSNISFTSEMWGTATVTPTPTLYAYNNTMYAYLGTYDCINGMQWYGNSTTAAIHFELYNNHCITDQTALHWFDGNGGSYGTWNGVSNPNSTTTQAVIDPLNTVMSPATAASQGYKFGNLLSPTASNNNTVTAQGTNFDTSCSGALTVMCTDLFGNSRPTSTTAPWNTGAYQFVGSVPPPPAGLAATPN